MGAEDISLENDSNTPTKKSRGKLVHELPGRDSNYDNIKEILIQYMINSNGGEKPLGREDFDKESLGFPNSHITDNMKFLIEMNLFQFVSRGKYTLTKNGEDVAEFLYIDEEENAKSLLRNLMRETWIYDVLEKAYRLKGSRIIPAIFLKRSLTTAANAYSGAHQRRLDVLLRYLESIDLLTIDNDTDKVALCMLEKSDETDIVSGSQIGQVSTGEEDNSSFDQNQDGVHTTKEIIPLTTDTKVTVPPTIDTKVTVPPTIDTKVTVPPTIDTKVTVPPTIDTKVTVPPTTDTKGIMSPNVQPSLQINVDISINFEVTSEMSADDVKDKLDAIMTSLNKEAEVLENHE